MVINISENSDAVLVTLIFDETVSTKIFNPTIYKGLLDMRINIVLKGIKTDSELDKIMLRNITVISRKGKVNILLAQCKTVSTAILKKL